SYSVSGEIQQMNWFKFISLGWWSGGILLFIFPGLHSLLVFAVMMICFQLIPGVILYRRFKKIIRQSNV
ncbi:MAG: hypothetical protein N2510_05840, partial [Ignavibacteria bacterium]|nr:hypothetical protein [Ignavibacteria bacterium]